MVKLYGVYNDERGTANRAMIIVDKQGIVGFKRVYSNMSEFSIPDILVELDKV